MKMKKLILFMAMLSFFKWFGYSEPLDIGAKAPELTATDQNGAEVKLGDLYSKGFTLVYFYPKADTPGCTAQACNLRDSFEELTKKGIQVVGVSADKPEAQKKFKEKYSLPFTLIADPDATVIKAFGVPLIVDKFVASRQSFLIKDGVVVWRDLKATPKQQAQDVLKAIESLSK
jgi:peroxiredoxin Q/BCP